MKDSCVGTFGVLALVLSTLVRVFAVSSLAPVDGLVALAVAHMLGRTMAVAAMGIAPAASGTGLGHSYTAHLPQAWTAAVVIASSTAAAGLGLPGVVALAAAAAGAVAVGVVAWRAFGGTTGDVLGAVEQVGEMAVLVSAASLVTTHGWSWSCGLVGLDRPAGGSTDFALRPLVSRRAEQPRSGGPDHSGGSNAEP